MPYSRDCIRNRESRASESDRGEHFLLTTEKFRVRDGNESEAEGWGCRIPLRPRGQKKGCGVRSPQSADKLKSVPQGLKPDSDLRRGLKPRPFKTRQDREFFRNSEVAPFQDRGFFINLNAALVKLRRRLVFLLEPGIYGS